MNTTFETQLGYVETQLDDLVNLAIAEKQPFQTQELAMALRAIIVHVRNSSNVLEKDTL